MYRLAAVIYKYVLVICFTGLYTLMANAQYTSNENKVWAFGAYSGVDFTSGSPVPISTSIITTEGCASVSNSSGALLFYTDGNTIWQSTGTVMGVVIPAGVSTTSTSQAALIMPRIGYASQYYVFSLEESSLGPSCRLWCCIVDMSAGPGAGVIVPGTVTPTPIASGLGEKLTAVAGNNCNIWLVSHKINAPQFVAYEITAAGISTTPVISTTGTFVPPSSMGGSYALGVITISPDRSKIALGQYEPFYTGCMGVELYDFDPNTGMVSNCRVLESAVPGYATEFSPDNTKLYTVDETSTGGICRVAQYDITLPTASAIAASRTILATGMGTSQLKLGPDGKIYLISVSSPYYLDAIANPNMPGAACNYTSHVVSLIAPGYGQLGLPNIVVTLLPQDTTYAAHDTTVCLTAGYTLSSPAPSGSYTWSTGATTPAITVTDTGTYWLRGQLGCTVTVDTFHVAALQPDAPPSISGDTLYCYGATPVPFSVSGANILWYTSPAGGTGTATAPVVNTSVAGTYVFYATQTLACESGKDSITVVVQPRIQPMFTSVINQYCEGGNVSFTNTSANATRYQWSFGDGSAADTSISPTHLYTASGTYNIMLTAYSGDCSRDTTIPLTVSHNLQAAVSLPLTICAGDAAVVSSVSAPAGAITSYTWTYGDGSYDTSGISHTHTYNAGGIYTVRLTVTDTSGCTDSADTYVNVLEINVESNFNDTSFCMGRRGQLGCHVYPNAIPGETMQYTWTPAVYLDNPYSASPSYYSDTAAVTVYTVTATLLPWGCQSYDTVRVKTLPAIPLTNVTASTAIAYGGSVQLNAASAVYYTWLPADGSLDNNNINNPVASPRVTTIYTVYGYDVHGCLDSATVRVAVNESLADCIPSAFTPNGDGMNDMFRPTCITWQKIVEMSVYNRWGERVYFGSGHDKGWDGTYMGVAQDAGVYFYMIIIARPDGQNITYKGDITLIR